jgi:hypothetical protein
MQPSKIRRIRGRTRADGRIKFLKGVFRRNQMIRDAMKSIKKDAPEQFRFVRVEWIDMLSLAPFRAGTGRKAHFASRPQPT